MTSSFSNLPLGCDVFTMDGSKLGQVKEVRDDYFKVDAPMRPDFWLPVNCVRGGSGIAGARVEVEFTKSHLDEYKANLD